MFTHRFITQAVPPTSWGLQEPTPNMRVETDIDIPPQHTHTHTGLSCHSPWGGDTPCDEVMGGSSGKQTSHPCRGAMLGNTAEQEAETHSDCRYNLDYNSKLTLGFQFVMDLLNSNSFCCVFLTISSLSRSAVRGVLPKLGGGRSSSLRARLSNLHPHSFTHSNNFNHN